MQIAIEMKSVRFLVHFICVDAEVITARWMLFDVRGHLLVRKRRGIGLLILCKRKTTDWVMIVFTEMKVVMKARKMREKRGLRTCRRI